MTLLNVDTSTDGGLAHVVLTGELDLSTVDQVEGELLRIEAEAPETILLDLAGLTFLDSTGLRLIVTADARAKESGWRLAIRRGPETVQRVFTITRLEERLDMVDSVDEVAG